LVRSNGDSIVSKNARADAAMDRYARGDDGAFADVYDAVAPSVHAYLVRQTRDRARAEDLLQQTLLQMHRHRGSYVSSLPVMPWAFAIARRLFIDELRHRKADALSSARGIEASDQVTPNQPEAEALCREMAELVEAELGRIPEAQRTAFELLRVDGLSQDEAAVRLGTTVSAVKLRAFRAYTALRAVLGHPFSEGGGAGVAAERRKP
jgi:RNA polymerase sigma-70 factor (ECF subfamily)